MYILILNAAITFSIFIKDEKHSQYLIHRGGAVCQNGGQLRPDYINTVKAYIFELVLINVTAKYIRTLFTCVTHSSFKSIVISISI